MIPTFDSVKHCFQFIVAKDFYSHCQDQVFSYPKNWTEKVGNALLIPFTLPTDRALQNIKNPLVITTLALVAIALVTIAFYPVQFVNAVETVAPFIFKIQPYTLKFCAYMATQAIILGLGLRTLGRMNNPHLIGEWNPRKLIPLFLGTVIVPRTDHR